MVSTAVIFDGASFALSQSYYFGSVNNNPAHRVVVTEGDCIDLRDDLDAGAHRQRRQTQSRGSAPE